MSDPHEREPVDQATIDGWRINYGLDKRTPAEAAQWWSDRLGGMAPAGAVAALGVALDELAEWHKLRDPVNLHVNLLRGVPAKMTNAQIWHLVADDRDRLADLELLAKHESDCAEAFKAEAAELRAMVHAIVDKRHTYGWGPEADAAIEAARLALGPNVRPNRETT